MPVNLLENNWEIWKDPETLLALCSLSESFFTCPVKGWEWSVYVEHSNVEILCGGKGAVCLSRDRHPSPEKVLNGTPKGGGSRALVQLLLQKTLVQSFPPTQDIPVLGQRAKGAPKFGKLRPRVLEP